MEIQLNSEQEWVVRQALQAGLDDSIERGIAAIRSRLSSRHAALDARQIEDWFRELTAWSESHSASTPLIPEEALNRDSIYGTRGIRWRSC